MPNGRGYCHPEVRCRSPVQKCTELSPANRSIKVNLEKIKRDDLRKAFRLFRKGNAFHGDILRRQWNSIS